jgi:hypothetical protein
MVFYEYSPQQELNYLNYYPYSLFVEQFWMYPPLFMSNLDMAW